MTQFYRSQMLISQPPAELVYQDEMFFGSSWWFTTALVKEQKKDRTKDVQENEHKNI